MRKILKGNQKTNPLAIKYYKGGGVGGITPPGIGGGVGLTAVKYGTSSGTCPAGNHEVMPVFQTIVSGLICPI